MHFVPEYLKGHVIENITDYEVHNASVSGWQINCKALTAEDAATMGLQVPPVPGKMYPVEMANTTKDRHRERFTVEVLAKYAMDINNTGASMNFGHSSQNLIGHVMKGSAKVEGGVLKGVVFIDDVSVMPNQPGMTVNHAIKARTVSDVSVEVSGTLRGAEKDSDGYPTVWEYYIDPERSDRTEFHGLALVMRGAQIGAALSVKALGGKPDSEPQPKKEKKSNRMTKEIFLVDGKKHVLTGAVKDGEFTFDAESLKALETAITELETKAQKAESEKAAESAKIAAMQAEVASLRAPFEADVTNFQKALNMPTTEALTADAIKALSTSELVAKANALRATVDAGAGKTKETDTRTTQFNNKYL